MYIAVIGRPDKGVDRHIFRHVGDVPAEHFANREVAEKDRRTDRDRADALGFQQKGAPRDMRSEDWRILAPNEVSLVFAGFFGRQHADIRPEEHGLERGEIAGEEPRLYDPKHGAFSQQWLGLPGRRDRDDTCVWSGDSSRLFTVPKTISLYFSCDWPACNPSPLSNEIL